MRFLNYNNDMPKLTLSLALLALLVAGFAQAGTPKLHAAVESGDIEKVREVLADSPRIDKRSKEGSTALHLAAWRGDRAIADLLIRAGAGLHRRDANNLRPLHCAIAAGHGEFARWIVGRGAHVDDWSDLGTPLLVAALVGDEETAQFLLDQGAAIGARTDNESTAMHIAAEKGHVGVLRLLLEAGADADLWAVDGTRPIHLATSNGHTDAAAVLLDAGVNVDSRDGRHFTSLHYSALTGNSHVARWLLEQGAAIAPKDKDGDTPLHVAAIGGHVEVAQVLLAAGADPALRNLHGFTPAMIAERMKHEELAAMLSARLSQR